MPWSIQGSRDQLPGSAPYLVCITKPCDFSTTWKLKDFWSSRSSQFQELQDLAFQTDFPRKVPWEMT